MKIEHVKEQCIAVSNKKRDAISLAEDAIAALEKSEASFLLGPIIKRAKISLKALLTETKTKHSEKHAKQLMERKKRISNKSRKTAANRYQRWSISDDAKIMSATISDEQIGREIGRSMAAVWARRNILRKIRGEIVRAACAPESGRGGVLLAGEVVTAPKNGALTAPIH